MAVSPSSSTAGPSKKRSSILGALRAAIKKVRFLLSFSATRWMLLSSIARGQPRRALSRNPRRPILLDAASPASSRTSRSTSMDTATTRSVSRTSSGASSEVLTRTSSGGTASASPGGDEDIDRRAEEFIANFYRQLQMERQVSLKLRYVRGNSWDRSPGMTIHRYEKQAHDAT